MSRILAYRPTEIYHDQGSYDGDSIAEIMWFESVEDFHEFLKQPMRKYQHWAICEVWQNPEKKTTE